MTKDELRDLLKSKSKENNGKVPSRLTIENEEYYWAGGQRIGENRLYRYRKVGVFEDYIPEKQIMLVEA